MLTRLAIRNFKLFEDVELELGERVVLIGPNNSGKTTVLQALALWDLGAKRWAETRGTGQKHAMKRGVTINRRDLIAVPVPATRLLWRDQHVRQGKTGRENIPIEIVASGIAWDCGMVFDYANAEAFYCRPSRRDDGTPMPVHPDAAATQVAYLPPMSGLAANETRLDPGAINVRLGEGRTAEVLRNLCYRILVADDGQIKWRQFAERIERLFGSKLDEPLYVPERGEISMSYRTRRNVRLDLSASGRGQQQTMLLLAHMTSNPNSVLLLDEPDAHLEILRQRQIYEVLSNTAEDTGSQIIAASHSEVVLNEAASRDVLIAFVGRPHRVDDRGSQALKALKEIGFEHYLQAEEKGWVLYLEGSTDLAILLCLARRLGHAAEGLLDDAYAHYVGNVPSKAIAHFYGLREAVPSLRGLALYDRLDSDLQPNPSLLQLSWRMRELENYLTQREVLLRFAEYEGRRAVGELFCAEWREAMEDSITTIETALKALGRPSPWGPDIKASDDFLDPLFEQFYERLGIPNLMTKTNYHRLAEHVAIETIDGEITQKLDAIVETATLATSSA